MCKLIIEILNSPDNLRLWLKFDAGFPGLNSASANDHEGHRITITEGEFKPPSRLPANRGMFSNWGVFFEFGNGLEIIGGIHIQEKLHYSHSKWDK